MIRIENLVKTFDGFNALNRLNLHVAKGSVYGLVGVNGSGKTTIIKHLAGVYRQDSGDVRIDGRPVYDNTAVKERIGYIPDDLYFFPSYSIGGLRSFYGSLYKNWDGKRFSELLDLFGLNERQRLAKLSKGMQKQAAFAFAMAIMPDVMLLDEPIDGLDPVARQHILRLIMDDVAARELTVLISSHNLKELEGVCDAVGIVKDGHMSVERDLDDLKSDIHKVQAAFAPDGQAERPERKYEGLGLHVLRLQKQGGVEILVVRGNAREIEDKIKTLHPLVADILPLSLEEIFIYGTDAGPEAGFPSEDRGRDI